MTLHANFDFLKSKLANIPHELDETTTGYNQRGEEPQQRIKHKGWLLSGILKARLASPPIRNWLQCQHCPSVGPEAAHLVLRATEEGLGWVGPGHAPALFSDSLNWFITGKATGEQPSKHHNIGVSLEDRCENHSPGEKPQPLTASCRKADQEIRLQSRE